MSIILQALKSKTVIVNTLTVTVGVLGFLAGNEIIAAYPKLAATVVMALGVANIALRFITTVPVWEK